MEIMKTITYPYLPDGRKILYVPATNKFIKKAKEYARKHSLDDVMPTGSVVVKNSEILGLGANGSNYHKNHECERIKKNIPTGQGYDLCEGCHPKNHSELKAIKDAMDKDFNPKGADLYLWGHWWCCEPCWDAIIKAGIKNVYLMNRSEILFNKENSDNIVGKQFPKYHK
ncbi:MAG: deaminase [Minisyncoccia bacterium]